MRTGSELSEAKILLVDTRCTALRRFGDSLQRAGYDVVEAASFDEAKRALVNRPTLLITNLRLGAFNGLHLLHLGRLAEPQLQAIILACVSESTFKDEADALGVLLMIEPVHTADLVMAAGRMLDDQQANPIQPIA